MNVTKLVFVIVLNIILSLHIKLVQYLFYYVA